QSTVVGQDLNYAQVAALAEYLYPTRRKPTGLADTRRAVRRIALVCVWNASPWGVRKVVGRRGVGAVVCYSVRQGRISSGTADGAASDECRRGWGNRHLSVLARMEQRLGRRARPLPQVHADLRRCRTGARPAASGR